MKKLVDRHIRNGALKKYPLLRNKHAYQTGKSTKTAFYNVVTCIESATEYKDSALGAFLDTEGAFDRTSFDIIKLAAKKKKNIALSLQCADGSVLCWKAGT
jgi:hypothetical protein